MLGVPLAEIDKLTKLIPGVPGMTLDKAIDAGARSWRELYNANPTDQAGHRHRARSSKASAATPACHAAGVIIADQPLDDVVPLCKDKDDNILTQFEGPIAEKCGLLKMDFLGLRTLTTLHALDRPASKANDQAGDRRSTSRRSTSPTRTSSTSSAAARPRASSSSNPAACRTC